MIKNIQYNQSRSTVVEHLPHPTDVKGSSPASETGEKKIDKKMLDY
jgi:hypothetical protein